MILAPIVRGAKAPIAKSWKSSRKMGYVRVRIDGELYSARRATRPRQAQKSHHRSSSCDRLLVKQGIASRLRAIHRHRAEARFLAW